MMKKESMEIAMAVARMNQEEESAFYASIEATDLFSEEEIKSIQIVVAYIRLQMFPEMAKAMKAEMAKAMYAEFNR